MAELAQPGRNGKLLINRLVIDGALLTRLLAATPIA